MPKGKNVRSLDKSEDKRMEVKLKYGFIPESIIVHDKSDKAIDLITDDRSYISTFWQPRNEEEAELIASGRAIAISSSGVRGGNSFSALSRFPQNIGRYLVKMYSEQGDTVLDPFAGHNSRMELVYKCERHYVGFDISHVFMEANRKIQETLTNKHSSSMLPMLGFATTITLFEMDSRKLNTVMGPSSADMVISSPPFWDIEYYGEEMGQLGKHEMYQGFLSDLQIIIGHCAEALKPSKFICLEVQDFRKDGRYYALHSDVIRIYREVGIKLHDIIIVDFGTSISAAFTSQLEEQKRTAKRHSYIIVGKKAFS